MPRLEFDLNGETHKFMHKSAHRLGIDCRVGWPYHELDYAMVWDEAIQGAHVLVFLFYRLFSIRRG